MKTAVSILTFFVNHLTSKIKKEKAKTKQKQQQKINKITHTKKEKEKEKATKSVAKKPQQYGTHCRLVFTVADRVV